MTAKSIFEFKTPEAEAHYRQLVDQHGKNAVHDLLRIPDTADKVLVKHYPAPDGSKDLNVVHYTFPKDGHGTHATTTTLRPDMTVHNDLNHVEGFPAGHGTKALARQVLAARKIGVPSLHIETASASEDEDKNQYNGYYTWPRLGFNGPIRYVIQKHFPGHKDLHSIFADDAAREKFKGLKSSTFDLTFDPHPDSEHSKRLLAYMKSKGIKV